MMPTGRRPIRARSLYPRRSIIVTKGKISLYKHRRSLRRVFKRFHAPMDLWRRFVQLQRDFKRVENIWKRRKTDQWKKSKKQSWSTTRRSTYRKPTTPWYRKMETWRDEKLKKKIDVKKSGIKKKTEFEPYIQLPRFGKKGFVHDRRGGARDMSGRKYENFGPFPKTLGPNLIFDIYPTSQLKASLAVAKARGSGKAEFMEKMIKKHLDGVREKLLTYAEKMIEIYVPKETGDLQEAMLKSLKNSKRLEYKLKINIEANIDYAGVVNKMPEKKLKHPKKVRGKWMRGRRSGLILNDPKAQKGSYYLIMMLLKEEAKKLIKEMIDDLMYVFAYRSTSGAWRRPSVTISKPYEPPLGKTISTRGKQGKEYNKYRGRGVSRYGGQTFTLKTAKEQSYAKTRPMTERERKETRNVRWQQWRTRIHKEGEATQVNYSRHLIKGWFKIKGLYKYR